MTTSRLARIAGAGTTTALLVLAAGCGSSSDSSASSGSGSSSASSGSDSAVSLTSSNLFSTLVAAQKAKGTYTFALKAGAAGQTSTGSGSADVSGSKPSIEAQIKAGAQTITTVAVGKYVYIKSAASPKYIKIDTTDKSGPGALFGSTDPAQQLKVLGEAAKVTKAGSEQVDGVDTTEYKVTVPGSALAKSNPTLSKLASALPKTVTYEIYVDSDNLLRKLENELSFQGQKIDTELTFSDYGKAVSIKAPPASQTTTDLKSLLGSTAS